MWVIPVGLCLRNHWWRFPCVWLVFSLITSVIIRKSLEKPIEVSTAAHMVEYLVEIIGIKK